MNRPKIVSIGEVLWDLYPDGERLGGAPANFACHASILGGEVTMVSAIGDDLRGREAAKILRGFEIDCSFLQLEQDAATGAVNVQLDADGKPSFSINDDSAWDRIRWHDKLATLCAGADAVYFGTLAQRSEISAHTIFRCMESARQANVPRVLDINLRRPYFNDVTIRKSVGLASVLKLSSDELDNTAAALGIEVQNRDQTLRQIITSEALDLVVMTLGAEGAVLVSRDAIVKHPGVPSAVQDTVGAGDAFTATFVHGLLSKTSHQSLLQKSCEIAASVCETSGAVPTVREQHPPQE